MALSRLELAGGRYVLLFPQIVGISYIFSGRVGGGAQGQSGHKEPGDTGVGRCGLH